MGEGVARTLGAGDGVFKIAGKECKVRPLGTRELAEVERECLTRYKRNYIKTFTDNIDLLPENTDKDEFLAKKFEAAARWDMDDLPRKNVCDYEQIEVTKKLKARIQEIHNDEKNETDDDRVKKLTASAIDSGTISVDQYKELTGKTAPLVKVGYVNWWISGCVEGMLTLIWMCFKDDGVTYDEVTKALSDNTQMMVMVSRRIEELSAAKPDFT